MGIFTHGKRVILSTVLVFLQLAVAGQGIRQVWGTVYERSARYGMAGVSVMSTSGAGAVTDSTGHYRIKLLFGDSISFSYQGKATMKFAVDELPPNHPFDIGLHIDIKTLPTVEVAANKIHDYKQDSIEFRNEYRKVFDFERDYLSGGSNGMGVGINLDLLLSGKKAKRIEMFQRRLIADEHEKYVDHRFNKGLVIKITGLRSPALDTFMVRYRPSYEELQGFENDYEYYKYVKEWGTEFYDEWKRRHPARQ